MTKTIEELAKQYAEDMCPVGDYCGGVYDEQRNSDLPICTDDAKDVLSWLFAKPLSSRLTAEEKERVRKIYTECELIEMDDNPNLPADRITEAAAKIQVLESIFGTDFFKEGE